MVRGRWELFLLLVCAALSYSVLGQATPLSPPASWTAIADLAAFDRLENDRLSRAQQAIETLTSLKVPRTIDNTLVPFDEAIRQLNSAAYLAKLVEEAHPDSTYRDPVERGTEPRTCKDPIGQHEGETDPPEIAVANRLSANRK